MNNRILIAQIIGFVLVGGCTQSQTVRVVTIPPGASISVDQDYIGESPADYFVADVGAVNTLQVEAVKANYVSQTKNFKKRNKRGFPKSIMVKLDPTPAARITRTPARSPGTTTTVQGPTIVFAGTAPAPQVSPPQAPPASAPQTPAATTP